ncbi:ABC transporter permease [Pseudonocardia sp. HH130629-09]|uniref:ABC transporter permease n=1 Tax=Pseudonocardia sp. HH130629-09 TaxID=1641402 RepID=UPI0006CB4701|nr:ABC transporter permease [Pseudonocardia sp. HH130629-09]ALE81841.1 hypothetical protein XF36_00805 [Pseudonocardia sp. HH130629-09]
MTWVIWRSHRAAMLAVTLLVAGLALLMATLSITGSLDGLLADPGGSARQSAQAAVWFATLAPALAGAFLGAPLFAADLERGTHVLLLTQSVSRRRWATTSLLVVGGVTVAAVTVGTLLLRPLNSSDAWYPFESFSTSGAVPFARTVSAFAIGALIGLLVRRARAASALTLAVATITEVALVVLRDVLVPPVLRVGASPYGGDVDSTRDQLVDYGPTVAGAPATVVPNCTPVDLPCQQAAGVDGTWVLVRPLDLRWPMHWVETGLHLACAGVVLALLFMRLRSPLGR